MKDEPLDFLPILVLLAIVIPICLGLGMKTYKNSVELVRNENYDKTVKQKVGEQYYSNNDTPSDMSYTEAVLTAVNQNYFMPIPRVIDAGTTVFQIQSESTELVNPGGSYSATEFYDYIPGGAGTRNKVHDSMLTWCETYDKEHKDILGSSRTSFAFSYNYRFTTGTEEGVSDDKYVLCIAAYDSDGNKMYLDCTYDKDASGSDKKTNIKGLDLPSSYIHFISVNSYEEVAWIKKQPGHVYVPYNERGDYS